MNKSEKKEWIAAFDPGKVNFAFIIEEIDTELLQTITCPSKRDRFVKKGKEDDPTESYINFLEKFYHCGRTVQCVNTDITKDIVENPEPKKRRKKGDPPPPPVEKKKKGSKALDASIFLRLTERLAQYKEYFDKCSTIIIEQQMSFGTKINTMAIKIAQHTYSYFLFRYGASKKIIEFPSYNKTQILGAPAGLEKPQRKKWAVSKADEIWALRGDLETVDMVKSKKKKDDMSDCLLHVLSYMILSKYG